MISCNGPRAFLVTLAVLAFPALPANGRDAGQNQGRVQTTHFEFDAPLPWRHAAPMRNGKNQARLLLKSEQQRGATGLFIVDMGRPAGGIQETIQSLMTRMVPRDKTLLDVEITSREVKLDGVSALALQSDQAAPETPCMVIVCFHNAKQQLFLLFTSVSSADDLPHRDAMLTSLEETWNWR